MKRIIPAATLGAILLLGIVNACSVPITGAVETISPALSMPHAPGLTILAQPLPTDANILASQYIETSASSRMLKRTPSKIGAVTKDEPTLPVLPVQMHPTPIGTTAAVSTELLVTVSSSAQVSSTPEPTTAQTLEAPSPTNSLASSSLVPTVEYEMNAPTPTIFMKSMAADTDEPLIPATPAHTTAANVLSMDLVNGDFESGLGVGWSEYSSNGYSIITQVDVLKPHSGSWAAWLGGIDDEQSYIQQDFSINGEPAALTYWYWIESVDTCNSDTAQVMADETILLSLDLCESSATGGWVEGEADLGAFIGQTITLKIEVDTDESYRSSMFIDDVSMGDDLESLFLPLVVR